MKLEFDKSFSKSLEKIKEQSIFKKTLKIISFIESVDFISEIPNTKKWWGMPNISELN